MRRLMIAAAVLLLSSTSGWPQNSPGSLTQKNPALLKSWSIFSPMDCAFGLGTISDAGFRGGSSSGVLSLSFFNIATGLKSTKKIGVGTAVFEAIAISNADDEENGTTARVQPASFFPVYLYYPLYAFNRRLDDDNGTAVKSPFIYLFAGGSAWSKYSHYLHFGIKATLVTWDTGDWPTSMNPNVYDLIITLLMKASPRMNLSLQSGFFYANQHKTEEDDYRYYYNRNNRSANNKDSKSNLGFYVSVVLGIGAAR